MIEIDKNEVVRMLVAVTRKVGYALDDSEEIEGDDGRAHVISGQSFDDLCDALAALDELPDDKPGCTMNAADKAEWALRSASDSQQWDDLPKKLMRAARREALTNEDRVAIGRAIARMEMIDEEQKRSAALRAKLDWAYTEIERLKMIERHPDPLHLSRILHELAGAASLCWEPRPTGVFDSQLAIQFVEQALAEIRSRMTSAPAEAPMPKPVAYGFGNTAITGHTNRLMMVRIDVPLDDQYAGAFWLPLVLADEAHTYGVACRAAGEAAGYARGLADAGRDAERYRWLCDGATEQQWVELGGYTVKRIIDGAIDALRGEVK